MSDKAAPKNIIRALKGLEDLLPAQTARWQHVERVAHEVFRTFGYSEIRTPIIEATELFARSVGEAADVVVSKQMYTFIDAGERSNTLRPEGTAGVVRALVEHGTFKEQPLQKLYYMGPMFRYERPQKGRQRQFHQIGVEVFGIAHPAADVEVIALCDSYLRKLGFTSLVTHVNNIGCRECRPAYNALLRKEIQGAIPAGAVAGPQPEAGIRQTGMSVLQPDDVSGANTAGWCPQCLERARINPMRVFDCKVERCGQLVQNLPRINDHVCDACRTHFDTALQLMDAAGIPYELDQNLVRGFDYYSRTVFEVMQKDIGAQSTILGGGRYDYLVEELGGPAIPGVGMGVGVERLLLALQANGLAAGAAERPEYYALALDEESLPHVLRFVQAERAAGRAVAFDCQPRSMKAGLKAANRVGAQNIVIVGANEVERGVMQRKNLDTGEQVEIPLHRN